MTDIVYGKVQLSKNAIYHLKKIYVTTIEQLLLTPISRIESIPMGMKTLREIKSYLTKLDEKDELVFYNELYKKNLWLINDLKELFSRICIHSMSDSFNYLTFYRAGYVLSAKCAFRNIYSNLINCLEKEIFSKDILYLSLYNNYSALGSFNTLLEKKMNKFDYIEIEPYVLFSRNYLEKEYNIYFNEIIEFQNRVLQLCNDKYFNANSIWDCIKNDETALKMKNNKWLCNSLLRQKDGIYSQNIANTIIFSKNPDILNLTKICEWLVSKYDKHSLNGLVSKFNELFDANITQDKIATILKSDYFSDLVNDSIDSYVINVLNNTKILDDEDLLKEDFT